MDTAGIAGGEDDLAADVQSSIVTFPRPAADVHQLGGHLSGATVLDQVNRHLFEISQLYTLWLYHPEFAVCRPPADDRSPRPVI